ncbi:hypothetical protein EBB07_28335 [Paenibacillaceae bacterium]|nr:hypothetical protein EBB07_28335 [Paenibacillaceae bacterium]
MTLDINKLNELMNQLIPEYDHQDIDKFVAAGNKIESTVLITSLETMKNIAKLRTKHGLVRVQYSKYIPANTFYLVRVPQELTDYTTFSYCYQE